MRSIAIRCWHCAVRSITAHFIRSLHESNARNQRRKNCLKLPYCYIKKRTQWMRYHSYQRQKLPRGSGITEAACKVVFTQRLKRSGMSWTISGGQVILDLRVLRLSHVLDEAH